MKPLNESAHPVDHGWAWVIMIATFAIHFLCIGFMRSLGILFVEFQERFQSSGIMTSLINGTEMLTYSLLTLLVMNLLLKRTSVRCVCFVGSLMQFLGLCLSSQVSDVSQLIPTMGVIFGAGHALLYCPILLIVSLYFDKKRAIATAISSTGTSLGGIIIPMLTRYLVNQYALSGALLLLAAGVSLQQAIFAGLLTPPSDYHFGDTIDKDSDNSDTSETSSDCISNEKVDKSKYDCLCLKGESSSTEGSDSDLSGCDYTHDKQIMQTALLVSSTDRLRSFSVSYQKEPPKLPVFMSTHSLKSTYSISPSFKENILQLVKVDLFGSLHSLNPQTENQHPGHYKIDIVQMNSDGIKRTENHDTDVELGSIRTKDSGCSSFTFPPMARTLKFWLATVFFVCGGIGSAMPYVYTPPLAREKGLSNNDAAMLMTVSAASDIAGRIAPGIILHFGFMRPSTVVILPLSLCGTLFMFTHLYTDRILMYLFASLSGFLSAGFWATQSLVIIDLIGMENLAPALAFYSIALGTGCAASFPLAGALCDLFETYDSTFKFFGFMYILSVSALGLIQITGSSSAKDFGEVVVNSSPEDAELDDKLERDHKLERDGSLERQCNSQLLHPGRVRS